MYMYLAFEHGVTYVMLRNIDESDPHPLKSIFKHRNWFVARDFMRRYAAKNGFTWTGTAYEK